MNNIFSHKTIFEHLTLGDMERVNTEVIAWIISENCNAFPTDIRINIINELFGLNCQAGNYDIFTEKDSIDLSIVTESDVLILENKFKSSQHSNQLLRYSESVKMQYPNHNHKYVFLTLINEQASDDKWEHLSYHNVYQILTKYSKEHLINLHAEYVKEYTLFIEKTLTTLDLIIENPKEYDFIFYNGKKKKADKKFKDFASPIEEFITKSNLETILQKAYLMNLMQKFSKKYLFNINDTHGSALIDIYIDFDMRLKSKTFNTFLQLQENTIKFAFAINKDYHKSHENSIAPIVPIYSRLEESNVFGYKRLNNPKKRAYISLSKQMQKPYWEMQETEFYDFLQTELNNATEMSSIVKTGIESRQL